MNDEHPAIAKLLAAQPNLGAGDESKCLPSWIKTFAEKWDAGEGITLSHNAAGALCHTLVAARERTRRLVRERDANAAQPRRCPCPRCRPA